VYLGLLGAMDIQRYIRISVILKGVIVRLFYVRLYDIHQLSSMCAYTIKYTIQQYVST
jgi:hypothetical protein